MTEGEIIRMLRLYCEGLFPKVCPNCGRIFATLREYIVGSQRLWPSVNYDVELGDYKTPRPIGGLAMSNCSCGTTLALSTVNLPVSQTHLVLEWIRAETELRGVEPAELFDYLRDEVRKQVLAEATGGAEPGIGDAASVRPTEPAPSTVEPAAVVPLGD
jgi:hypothetical protein